MANIYVSPTGNDSTGDGSSGNPYQHIHKGIDIAAASGDTIVCKDGIYNSENYRFISNKDITIISESTDYTKVIIEVNSGIGNTDLWRLDTSVLRIFDISFEQTATTAIIGNYSNGGYEFVRCFVISTVDYNCLGAAAQFARIYKSTFRNCSTSSSYYAIYNYGGYNEEIKDCIFDNCYNATYYYNYGIDHVGDYNCFYNCTNIAQLGSTNINDITLDPQFTGSTVASISSTSPCVNAGTIITGYIDTFSGIAPDIGVFEVSAIIVAGVNNITIGQNAIIFPPLLFSGENIIEITQEGTFSFVKFGNNTIVIGQNSLVFPLIEYGNNIILIGQQAIALKNAGIEHILSFGTDIRFYDYIEQTIDFNTDIRLAKEESISFSTDIRYNTTIYDNIGVGTLLDFHIKLDGTELEDADLNSANINWNLGATPSTFNCTLARHHDKLNYTLDGTFSEITNENKIEIYDGTKLLYTGYITKIAASSQTDTVAIIAEDIRYKANRSAPIKITYGYFKSEERQEIIDSSDIYFENNQEMVKYILDTMVANNFILGYNIEDISDFSLIVEGISVTNSYLNLLESLISEIGTYKFYVDENEFLHIIPHAAGTLKTLSLSSIDKRRHPYDVLLSDVNLNVQTSDYTKGLRVKHGKVHTQNYGRDWFNLTSVEWNEKRASLYKAFKDFTWFNFLSVRTVATQFPITLGAYTLYRAFTGEKNILNYSSSSYAYAIQEALLQWEEKNEYETAIDSFIGEASPEVVKDINFENYGTEISNGYYEERAIEEIRFIPDFGEERRVTINSLYFIQPEQFDFRSYAIDLANLDLSRRNKLLTTATVSLFLDAFCYYNLSFKDLINLNNTIQTDIYNNNNGFPLNIESYSLELGSRLVTLQLTNDKSEFFKRTINYKGAITNEFKETKITERFGTPAPNQTIL